MRKSMPCSLDRCANPTVSLKISRILNLYSPYKMKIGCFALIEPFQPLERQFQIVKELGFDYIDLTDNHDGATLGVEFGFAASQSLDGHPKRIREMAQRHDLEITTVCAHANLLDAASPERYGTTEIIKALRLAGNLGIHEVITTEGESYTDFGHNLSTKEQLLVIREKLQTPIEWAEELGIRLLFEPHGPVTDSVELMGDLLDSLGREDSVGICLDTGNSWLGGSEPLDFVKTFGSRIGHVHWKDMPAEWEEKRGKQFGCGMSPIPLGDGVVGIPQIVEKLAEVGFSGATTLEVAGADAVKVSAKRLHKWSGVVC